MLAPVSCRLSPHGLLSCLQETFLTSSLSVYALQRLTGISAATIRRILDSSISREIGWLEILLDKTGIALLARTADRPWTLLPSLHRTLGFVGNPLPLAFDLNAGPPIHHASMAPGDGILQAIRQVVPAGSRREIRAATRDRIPRQALDRMLTSDFMRVGTYAQMLLGALGASLCLVTARGDAMPVPSPRPNPDRGLSLCMDHRAQARRSAGVRSQGGKDLSTSTKRCRGQLLIGKRDVLKLYEEHGLDHREIAILSGVSRERIRQILATMGAEPIRQRRKRLLLGSICNTYAPAPVHMQAISS